jgi:nitrate reductase molybdenum cofactor assembly chaperone
MNDLFAPYTMLAGLFSYPDAQFDKKARHIQACLEDTCADAAAELREFTEFAFQASLVDLEELYTRSFDVQAVTTLDLGYVLFGDDYKRGELLVNLSNEHRHAGVDCGTELPDHLPNVLRLLDAMQKPELRRELVMKIVGPALRKIMAEFDPARLEKKNAVYERHHNTLIERSERYGTIYEKPLRALYTFLREEFDIGTDEELPIPHRSQFLSSIGTEMTLESEKEKCHECTR